MAFIIDSSDGCELDAVELDAVADVLPGAAPCA